MDYQSSCIKFALVGHQDSWINAQNFVNRVRRAGNMPALSIEKIKEIYTYIPPRNLFGLTVNSKKIGPIKGAYLESFIAPDELDSAHLQKNIGKVRESCELASRIGAKVVSLGGFSSIVLESGNKPLTNIDTTQFTTGNTLTAAFISKGVEKACELWKIILKESTLLIIGSTGDIGSACVTYFSGKVKKIILSGRNEERLKKQAEELKFKGITSSISIVLKEQIKEANIIISVASSNISENDFGQINKNTIVCDAGYPKNLQSKYLNEHPRYFLGGMGLVLNGFSSEDDEHESYYNFPVKNSAHGCMLESIVLAMDQCYRPFSSGKGNINMSAMEEILEMAKSHGIETAPLFNNEEIISVNL